FETFLFTNRSLVAQIVRKFGSKKSGTGEHLREFYEMVLKMVGDGLTNEQMLETLASDREWKYLQPAEAPYESRLPEKFTTQVKAGIVIRELMPSAPRCGICGAVVPPQAMSIDHSTRRDDGGTSAVENAQIAHPYCNTGYKEAMRAKAKK